MSEDELQHLRALLKNAHQPDRTILRRIGDRIRKRLGRPMPDRPYVPQARNTGTGEKSAA